MPRGNKTAGKTAKPVQPEGNAQPATVRSAAATLSRYRDGLAGRPAYVVVDGHHGLSVCNGDEIATFLAKHDAESVMRIAEVVCGLEAGSLAAKYAARNNGMKRMNAGNRIRAAYKAGRTTMDAIKAAARKA